LLPLGSLEKEHGHLLSGLVGCYVRITSCRDGIILLNLVCVFSIGFYLIEQVADRS